MSGSQPAATSLDPRLPARLAAQLEARFGLHIPRKRWGVLNRTLREFDREMGPAAATEHLRRLFARQDSAPELQALLRQVTVGETYFFRDRKLLSVLERQVLAPLVARRGSGEARLRIMSAGCSTGEEAYTLAIIVRRLLPDLARWKIDILGADVNDAALARARDGRYSSWSFRKEWEEPPRTLFDRESKARWRIRPELRAMVAFLHLNLAADAYPAAANDTAGLDLIVCRNVLMYFVPEVATAVIGRLRDCLVPGGCLVLGAGEVGLAHQLPGLAPTENVGILVRSGPRPVASDDASPVPAPPTAVLLSPIPAQRVSPSPPRGLPGGAETPDPTAWEQYAAGRYAEAADTAAGLARDAGRAGSPAWTRAVQILVRSLANLREHGRADAEALRAIALDILNPELHYLRASILLEAGQDRLPLAREELQRALYLDSRFALAHVLLGELARAGGEEPAARRHFRTARDIAAALPRDAVLAGGEGMSAGNLAALLDVLAAQGGQA